MKKSKTIVVYLALLSMLAYISTNMYLPVSTSPKLTQIPEHYL